MIKISIVGGAGYTAGELLRLLINHPMAEICSVVSTTSAGKKLYAIHKDLLGETEICFSDIIDYNSDVIFLCLGHGLSRKFIDTHPDLNKDVRIIDLGNDFRLEPNYMGREFVYGMPDCDLEGVTSAKNIANPGCFATAIQLALLPLAVQKKIVDEVHIHALTGSTGAGKSPGETTHFSYRDSNVSIYKSFSHQHLGEIALNLGKIQESEIPQINFVPIRGDFARGIFASIYTKIDADLAEVVQQYKDYYANSPFVHVADCAISMKEVVNTNKCVVHVEQHQGYIHITSVIDNLLKGASGQAVENMNIMFGLDRDLGLRLKPSSF